MNYDVTFEEQNTEFDVDFGENVIIGGGATVPPDEQMSDTSTNAVQNKVIKAWIDGIVANVAKDMSDQHNEILAIVEKFILENLVFKEEGKGLSTNDFTDDYKTKLDNSVSTKYVDDVEANLKLYVDSVIGGIENGSY